MALKVLIVASICILVRSSLLPENDEAKTENEALKNMANNDIAFEKNLIWIEKLKTKNKSIMAFVDAITLKYEIRDIVEFVKKITDEMRDYNYQSFKNESLKREFELLVANNYNILPLNETIFVTEAVDRWNGEYVDADEEEQFYYCIDENKTKCNREYIEMLHEVFLSNDNNALKFMYDQILDVGANKSKNDYDQFLELYDKAAKSLGFDNTFEMLIHPYEDTNIEAKIDAAMLEVFPLFEQIHAHLRHTLPDQNLTNFHFDENNVLIPEYLSFKIILDSYTEYPQLSYPFDNDDLMNYNQKMLAKEYTPEKMIEKGKEFYESLGLNTEKMKYKVIIDDNLFQPNFDYGFGRRELKIRLGSCISDHDLSSTFGAMLKLLNYEMSYYKQPYAFRIISPDGFLNALADAVMLSASSPTYLQKLSLIDENGLKNEHLINKLYKLAVQRLFPLQGERAIKETIKCMQTRNSTDTNCKYWDNRRRFQGVTLDGRTNDYDVLHLKFNSIDEDDIQSMFTSIVSFQIYEGICKMSGQYSDEDDKPLALCDFSGNKEVGKILGEILTAGSSVPWQVHFQKLTKDKDVSPLSLLKYFKPLKTYLENYHRNNNIKVGW